MEETHQFVIESPSGYTFRSLFIVKYIERDDGARRNITASLYVGNPKMGNPMEACTTLTVQYPDSVKEFEEKYQRPSNIDPTIASLVLTKYAPGCSENRALMGGEGTIEMILSAMSLLKQLCPFIKDFDLNDASSKECEKGVTISLPYFYLTNHHQTWYEAKFQARLKPEGLMETYRKTFQDLLQSPLESFDVFQARFLSRVIPRVQDAIRASYEGSDTVDTFFKRLYEQNGTKMACLLLHGWIEEYMRLMKIEPFVKHHKWFISSDVIPDYRFRNEKKSHRVTRKKDNGVRRRTLWNENNQKGSGRSRGRR